VISILLKIRNFSNINIWHQSLKSTCFPIL